MTTYSLLFFLKKSRGASQDTIIYGRITVAGKRSEFSTGNLFQRRFGITGQGR